MTIDVDRSEGTGSEHSLSPVKLVECNERNLIVNYVPPEIRQDELKAVFSSAGEVESVKIIRDKESGQSLCYGFVLFASVASARIAIEKFNGMMLYNKKIKVSLARPSSPEIKDANLYVSGFPKMFTFEDFSALFTDFGEIITGRILYDAENRSRGVGFIRLDTRANAEKAMNALHGTRFTGYREKLSVKFANAGSSSTASPSRHNQKSPSLGLSRIALPLKNALSTAANAICPFYGYNRPNFHQNPPPPNPPPPPPTALPPLHIPTSANSYPYKSFPVMLPVPQFQPNPPVPTFGSLGNMSHQFYGLPSPALTTPNHVPHSNSLYFTHAHPLNIPAVGSPPANIIPSSPLFSPPLSPFSHFRVDQTPPTFPGSGPHHPPAHPVQPLAFTIMVYNLPYDCQEQEVFCLFSPLANVKNVTIFRDYSGKTTLTADACVAVSRYDEAILLSQAYNGFQYKGNIIEVAFKNP